VGLVVAGPSIGTDAGGLNPGVTRDVTLASPILIRRGLTARALNIYIGLDSTTEVHELSMFADNMGEFPPNTALMVISDSQKRYEIYLSASLKQNASIRLRRPRRL